MTLFKKDMAAQKGEIEDILRYFQDLKIDTLYIPMAYQKRIRVIQPDLFGTRSCPFPLYDIEAYVKEALTKPQDAYLLLGYDGHGVASRGIHYYLVTDELALFVQRIYGSVVDDEEFDRSEINTAFLIIKRLFESIQEVKKKHVLGEGRRLFVVDSDFYGKGWGWIDGYPGKIEESSWHPERSVLPVILNEVEKLF